MFLGHSVGIRCYRFVVCLFVYLSRSCIVLKRQKITARFLLNTTAACLSKVALTLDYIGQPLPPQKLPQSDLRSTPVDLIVGDIRWQIAAEWSEIAQWSQWRAYRKPPSTLSNGTNADPLWPPLPPKYGSQIHPLNQLRDVCCHLANMIEDIDKLCAVLCRMSVAAERCCLLPN